MVRDLVAGIPGPSQANAAKPSPAGCEVRIQHRGHGIPESQIGGAHDRSVVLSRLDAICPFVQHEIHIDATRRVGV